mgnify:CR=1 FL=1
MKMQSLMAQAQKLQRDITKKKEEIEKTEFEGKSEWVEVVFTGDRKLKSFKVLKDNIVDQDDIEMLQDMSKIAIDNALNKIDKEYTEKMGMYSSMNGLM